MAEPPVTEGTPRDEGDTGDESKSQKSGVQSQRESKAGSRPPSGGSKKSARSEEKRPSVPLSPTGSAKENPAADWRNMRRIIAEDPEWSLATVPLLVELCLKHIVADFESKINQECIVQLQITITLQLQTTITTLLQFENFSSAVKQLLLSCDTLFYCSP